MFRDANAFSSFSVNDLSKAREFYGTTLGLETTDPQGQLSVRLGSGGNVFIYEKPNHEPATFTVLNFVVADVEQAVDRLTDAGVRFEHYDDEPIKTNAKGIAGGDGFPLIAWFRDPAGNILSVIDDSDMAGQ